jgi:hypothetical protein
MLVFTYDTKVFRVQPIVSQPTQFRVDEADMRRQAPPTPQHLEYFWSAARACNNLTGKKPDVRLSVSCQADNVSI